MPKKGHCVEPHYYRPTAVTTDNEFHKFFNKVNGETDIPQVLGVPGLVLCAHYKTPCSLRTSECVEDALNAFAAEVLVQDRPKITSHVTFCGFCCVFSTIQPRLLMASWWICR